MREKAKEQPDRYFRRFSLQSQRVYAGDAAETDMAHNMPRTAFRTAVVSFVLIGEETRVLPEVSSQVRAVNKICQLVKLASRRKICVNFAGSV